MRQFPPQRGDEEQLFARYQDRLRSRTTYLIKTTPETVEDACAYAWMQLLACQPERDSVFAWLSRVARNEALRLDQLERDRMRTERSIDVGERAADAARATRGDADTALELRELRDRLMELSPRQREAVLLHAAGWRYPELSERLGVGRSRLSHLICRGVARMREMDRRDEEPHSPRGRRLRQIEQDPPRYIVAALGPQPRASLKNGREGTRREWQRLVLQIEDYRQANGIADEIVALGRGERVPPADLITRRILDYRRDRGLGMGIEL
jgi:RNA polymerase sigma factor (sigma-70 family)